MIIHQYICILGAGPGGLTTAMDLSQRGIPSVVVEKAQFPRHKADGDAITSNVLRTLYELSPEMYHRLSKRTDIIQPIRGFCFNAPNGKRVSFSLASPTNKKLHIADCYGCRRIDFDQFLLEEAKKSPLIQIIENCALHDYERTKEGGIILYDKSRSVQIHAKLLIIASGSNSRFTRILGGFTHNPKELAIGLRAYYKNVKGLEPGLTQCVLYKSILPGGICINPMADGTASISVIMRSYEISKNKLNPQKILQEALQTQPFLKETFKDAELVGEIAGTSLHLGVKDRKIAGDNYVMIGDAAGLADPISANGIGHAMITGRMAAEKAAECIEKNDFSEKTTGDFSSKVANRLRKSLRAGRLAFRFFGVPHSIILFATNLLTLFSENEAITELMFSPNIGKTLISPSFYWKLFFAKKIGKTKSAIIAAKVQD